MASSTWFITGAGSGLGLEVTRQLLARGDRVAATNRAPAAEVGLAELVDRYGDRLWTATVDVTDAATVNHEVGRAFNDLGRIDVVFSCAGFGVLGAAEELSEDLLTRQIEVNLMGAIRVVRATVPRLRAQGGGRIIQMSSSGGHVPDPAMSVYNATKFGVEGFLESVAMEVAPFGIGVTLIAPGGVRTGFNAHIVQAQPLPAYADGVVGMTRAALGGGLSPEAMRHAIPGDPVRIAAAIIDSASVDPAPRRLVLGGAAYEAVTAALQNKLDALRAQKMLAMSTDADDVREH
ncbi:SDR family oxidoreductase [Fodinicola feengrottensis]|uniref:SDR family oxidoreductase n=1 Tax=Fodinicola feengrottensis TaxID=435914 RepID=UPI0031D1E747